MYIYNIQVISTVMIILSSNELPAVLVYPCRDLVYLTLAVLTTALSAAPHKLHSYFLRQIRELKLLPILPDERSS